MKFSKAKMLERVQNEGRMDMVDDTVREIMDDCDGQEVTTSCWERIIMDEPVVWCVGKSGVGHYVSDQDLI